MSAPRPGSQNARIIAALSDGKWKSTATIHRLAGTSRLNSRISELRSRGYVIEHDTVPGKKPGPTAHRYRLVHSPYETPVDPGTVLADMLDTPEPALTTDDLYPRDERNRFRIYIIPCGGNDLDVVATCWTPEAVGQALVTLGREGMFERCSVGVMDVLADEGEKKWVLNPWDARC